MDLRVTRSNSKQAAAATASAQAPVTPPPQDDTVTVNWAFFDKSQPQDEPLPIKIPRQLFESTAFECRNLFAEELRNCLKFETDRTNIKFWEPRVRISVEDVAEYGWTDSIENFAAVFKKIPAPFSFSKRLNQPEDAERVHLVVTAKGHYQLLTADLVEEEKDVVGALPEYNRYRETLSGKGLSPSAGAKSQEYINNQRNPAQAIYDGRHPPNAAFQTIAPPIHIFHPVFENFQRRCHDVQPTNDDLIAVLGLMSITSMIYPGEIDREEDFRAKLSAFLGCPVVKHLNDDGTSTDGAYVIQVNGINIIIFIIEIKRELGDGGSDPSTQGGLTMKRSWSQKKRRDIADKCCCPTLIIAGGGPWLAVLGGVITDKVIVQRLTDMMWIAPSSTVEDTRVYSVAQVFMAFRETLAELQKFYEHIAASDIPPLVPKSPHPRYFPYPHSYTQGNQTVHFEYLKPLEDDAICVTFLAVTKGDGSREKRKLVIKFVNRYGRDVHEFLAAEGHAPKLRYCGPLPMQPGQPSLPIPPPPTKPPPPGISIGPLQMVVMDYVTSRSKDLPTAARPQITKILTLLHKNGYVFGDLREPNIILNNEGKIQFIDFDWSGRYDRTVQDSLPSYMRALIPAGVLEANKVHEEGIVYAHYPMHLSKTVFGSTGAKDLAPIRPVHDWSMFNKLDFTD